VLKPALEIIDLGVAPYDLVYESMREYTRTRDENTPDQFWVVEHPPVFTLGQAGDPSHLIDQNTEIPVVKVDRGGQITFHGPGQVVIYLMLDLKRHGYFVRDLVNRMEQAIINTLADFGVEGQRKAGAPGIYLGDKGLQDNRLVGAKIAALGLKVSRHCCYHGLALNVDMDLGPFEAINPCGYAGLKTVDLATLGVVSTNKAVSEKLIDHLRQTLKLA
jgi:lipoyl(octanoyl) transferase